MLTPQTVSDYILSKVSIEDGDAITNLKLQKVLYYCQGWHLAVFEADLFGEAIEAWSHGPVVPSVYRRFSPFGRGSIIPTWDLSYVTGAVSERSRRLIDQVWSQYSGLSARELRNRTHAEPPWRLARGDLPEGERSQNVLDRATLMAFFKEERERLLMTVGLGEPSPEVIGHLESMIGSVDGRKAA